MRLCKLEELLSLPTSLTEGLQGIELIEQQCLRSQAAAETASRPVLLPATAAWPRCLTGS